MTLFEILRNAPQGNELMDLFAPQENDWLGQLLGLARRPQLRALPIDQGLVQRPTTAQGQVSVPRTLPGAALPAPLRTDNIARPATTQFNQQQIHDMNESIRTLVANYLAPLTHISAPAPDLKGIPNVGGLT